MGRKSHGNTENEAKNVKWDLVDDGYGLTLPDIKVPRAAIKSLTPAPTTLLKQHSWPARRLKEGRESWLYLPSKCLGMNDLLIIPMSPLTLLGRPP